MSQGEIKNGKIDFESNSKGELNISNKSFKYDTKKLGEIAELKRGPFGGSIKKEIFVNKSENNYQVYEQYNAINNDPYSGRYFITEKDFNRLKSFEIKPGDILMSCSGTIGKLVTIQNDSKPGIINQALLRIRLKPGINSKYFSIIFSKIIDNLIGSNELSYGAAIKNIASVSELKEIEIPIPPLKIQQEIVDRMDKAMAEKEEMEFESEKILKNIDGYILSELGIELQKQKEEKLCFSIDIQEITEHKRFDPAYFSSSFKIEKSEYELKNIYDIAEIKKGQSITQDRIIEGVYPVIAGGQTSPYTHNQKNYDGNIITVSASGAYSGYVRYHENPIFASDCSVVFSKDENLMSTFFIYTRLKINQKEIYKMQKGAGQPHVYPDDIGNFIIPLPPIEIQNKIINEVKSRIVKADNLKKQANKNYVQTKNEVEKMILRE